MSDKTSQALRPKFSPAILFMAQPKYTQKSSHDTKDNVTMVQSDKTYLLRFNREINEKPDTLVVIPNRLERSHLHENLQNNSNLSIDDLQIEDEYKINSHIEAQRTMNVFLNTIERNKKNLMQDLDLTEDEYYRLANIAMGIAEHETHFNDSSFVSPIGEERFQKRLIAKNIMSTISTECSQGLTQIKYNENFKNCPKNRQIAHKYGIKSAEDYKNNTSKCAIATMIILAGHLRTAESLKWQIRLEENNKKIQEEKEKITTDDIIALLWNGTGLLEKRFDNHDDVVKISDRNTAPEWKIQLHLMPKDGMSYPRYVRYYREKMFGGKVK